MEKTICEKCKYEWLARVEKPKKCPNCQNRLPIIVIKNKEQLRRDKVIKSQQIKTNKLINKGKKIEYDNMLTDLKKSAAQSHIKKPLNDMFV